MSAEQLSHLDSQGRPRMVDVSGKAETQREATARAQVVMAPSTLAQVKAGATAKGDVLTTAQLAAIQAAKQTHHLIPMCHPLMLSDIRVDLALNEEASTVTIEATVKATGKTGVEMEALTAVAVGALTVYDMCKAADPAMRIEGLHLVRKTGGKSDYQLQAP